MNEEFHIMTEASPTLNFLIYIQNIYRNQEKKCEYRFPYMDREYQFSPNFEDSYREKWAEAVRLVAANRLNGENLFYNERNFFCEDLFMDHASFNEVYQSFRVWWQSLTGQLAVERTVEEAISNIYFDLADSNPTQNLLVGVIYEDCFLGDLMSQPYFCLLTIRQCLQGKEKLRQYVRKSMK